MCQDAYVVAISAGYTKAILPEDPLREGCGKPHKFFLTRLSKFTSVTFSTFFDYGSSTCLVSNSLATRIFSYNISFISMISGIGRTGPTVTKDAIIIVQLHIQRSNSHSKWTESVTFSAGVVPDNTFPANLTLGQTVFHALRLHFLSDRTIQLSNLQSSPTLFPFLKDEGLTVLHRVRCIV